MNMKHDMKPNEAARRDGARGDALGSNSEIGRKLKQYYDELVTEEVPTDSPIS